MFDWLKKITGVVPTGDNGPGKTLTADAAWKTLRDALIAGGAVAGVLICDKLAGLDLSQTDYAWATPLLMAVLAAARRWFVNFQPKEGE